MNEKRESLQRQFRRWLVAHNADALVAFSPENVLHTSGAYIVSQRTRRQELAMAVFLRTGQPWLVASEAVPAQVLSRSWIERRRSYAGQKETAIGSLVQLLREQGVDKGHIALELSYLPAHAYRELVAALPHASFVDGSNLLERSRMVKSRDEIAFLQQIAVATEKAIEHGYTFAHPSDTERELVARMHDALRQLDVEWSPFLILAAGAENSCEQHHRAGSKRLARGDIVHTALVGYWHGYYTGFARMAVVGSPSERQQKLYHKLVAVQRFLIASARPGVLGGDLYRAAVAYSQEIGFPFATNIVGHSQGIGFHEYPTLAPTCAEPLVANMTLCVEVAGHDPAVGRMHIEDLILVGEHENKRLTDHMQTTEMVVIS